MTDEVGKSIRESARLVIDDSPPPYTKEGDPRWLSSDSPGRAPAAFNSPRHLDGYGGKKPSGRSYYDLSGARDEKKTSQQDTFIFTLHAIEGLGNVEKQVKMYRLCNSKWGHRNTLELVVDIGGRSKRFQWRPSKGKEMRGLAGYSSGWKLVRMASREAGVGGKRKSREEGFTSDGKEAVAVIAHSLSLRKDFAFAVLGSGRSGALGSAWEAAALLSGIWRWWNSVNGSVD
ncbi:hypothetical protein LY76DRAFT_627288 [Colletotrichum caudatum]|nr:hypothetical protein LY76DRAFT_627288 [Colletotrichum caudatum]